MKLLAKGMALLFVVASLGACADSGTESDVVVRSYEGATVEVTANDTSSMLARVYADGDADTWGSLEYDVSTETLRWLIPESSGQVVGGAVADATQLADLAYQLWAGYTGTEAQVEVGQWKCGCGTEYGGCGCKYMFK